MASRLQTLLAQSGGLGSDEPGVALPATGSHRAGKLLRSSSLPSDDVVNGMYKRFGGKAPPPKVDGPLQPKGSPKGSMVRGQSSTDADQAPQAASSGSANDFSAAEGLLGALASEERRLKAYVDTKLQAEAEKPKGYTTLLKEKSMDLRGNFSASTGSTAARDKERKLSVKHHTNKDYANLPTTQRYVEPIKFSGAAAKPPPKAKSLNRNNASVMAMKFVSTTKAMAATTTSNNNQALHAAVLASKAEASVAMADSIANAAADAFARAEAAALEGDEQQQRSPKQGRPAVRGSGVSTSFYSDDVEAPLPPTTLEDAETEMYAQEARQAASARRAAAGHQDEDGLEEEGNGVSSKPTAMPRASSFPFPGGSSSMGLLPGRNVPVTTSPLLPLPGRSLEGPMVPLDGLEEGLEEEDSMEDSTVGGSRRKSFTGSVVSSSRNGSMRKSGANQAVLTAEASQYLRSIKAEPKKEDVVKANKIAGEMARRKAALLVNAPVTGPAGVPVSSKGKSPSLDKKN